MKTKTPEMRLELARSPDERGSRPRHRPLMTTKGKGIPVITAPAVTPAVILPEDPRTMPRMLLVSRVGTGAAVTKLESVPPREQRADALTQGSRVEGLAEDRLVTGAGDLPSDEKDGRRPERRLVQQRLAKGETVETGHHDVGDDQIEGAGPRTADDLERLGSVRRLNHAGSHRAQTAPHVAAHIRVVVDDEDRRCGGTWRDFCALA